MPGAEVGEAFIAIRATTSQFAEEARSGVTSSLTSAKEQANVPVRMTVDKTSEAGLKRDVGSVVKNVAAYAGGIFAVAKVFDFGKEVVQEAAAVQKAEESIRSEYGKTAEASIAFAHGQATSMGISAAASETASAKVGALLRNLGETPAVASRNNIALQRTVGLMSEMKNIDPATVLAKLNTTLATGSTRGLRDLGVALDATTVKAEAMRDGLIKTSVDQGALAKAQYNYEAAQKAVNTLADQGKKGSDDYRKAVIQQTLAHEALGKAVSGTSGPLTVAAKDQAIINIITAHSGQLQAEAAKHSGDLAVQERVLSATWQNMKATLGEELLPVVTSFFHELIHGVDLAKEYKTELIGLVGVLAAASATWAAVTVTTKAWTAATEIAAGVQKLLNGNLIFTTSTREALIAATREQAIAEAMAAGATEAEGAAAGAAAVEAEGLNAALLANPIGVVIVSVAALAFGLYELYEHSKTAREVMQDVWHEMGRLEAGAVSLVRRGIGPLEDALGVIARPVGAVLGDIHDLYNALGGMDSVAAAFGDAKSLIVGSIGLIAAGVEGGLGLVEAVWGDFWGGGFGDEVRFGVRLVKAEVMGVVRIVEDVVDLVGNVIHGRWGNVWGDLGNLARDGIRLMIVDMLALPALVLHGGILIGEAIWSGIRSQVVKLPGEVWGVIREIPGAELRGLGIIGNAALRLGSAALHALIGEAKKLPGQTWGVIRELPGEILRGDQVVVHAAETLARHLVTGAISEARHLPGRILGVIHEIGPMIAGIIPWVLAEGKKLGSRLLHGAISGVENLAGDLKSKIEDGVKGALSDLNPFSPVEHGGDLYIARPIMSGTVKGLDPFQGQLQRAIIPVIQTVLGRAQTVGVQQGQQLGTDISRNTINGTHGLSTGLASAIIAGANAALAHAKAALGIHSPSSLFAREIGQPLAEGIIHGLGGLEAGLTKKLVSSVQASMSAVGGSFGNVSPQGSAAIGANQILGRQMMLAAGWGADQWGALQALWNRESGWNANAVNPSSGAAGIPQALGHGHVFNLGDARAQIAWGLDYIRGRYGSPSAAWAHETAVGWYGGGGRVPGPEGAPQVAVVHGGEVVFTPDQLRMLSSKGVHVDQLTIISPGGDEAAEMFLNHVMDRA